MNVFVPKMGSWTVKSEKDPRWDNNGRGEGLISSGGPREMHDWVNKCKKEIGDPPEDLICSFLKD